ncbi:uncharacterized protein LOC129804093 isoform X1 [Phlebotomus papatasi]|uniref:uncharacterized protein LOC129804093 isoform X1 n=1 Tax=Phlebotomus papatasi TaxID=29031 RepID=UPI0024844591|nr:uncharacterized protein LOC129804093 isoform X1 [Phlebotomus papatasi]
MEVKTEDDDVVFLEIVKEEYEIQGGSSTLKVEETEEIQKNEDHAEVAEAIEQPREVAIKEKGDPVPLSKIAFICPKCRKTFKNKGVLKRHLKWHSRTPKQYPCRNCEQIFPCYKTLSAHRQTHRLFECAKCGKCYDIKNSLKNHLLSNHYGLSWSQSRYTGGKFKCEECEKSFARKFYYNRHIEIHKEGQLGHLKKCPNCNKRFRTKPKLEKHQSLCNQAKICKVCNKSFKSFGHFIIHLRKHSDYKDLPPRLQCIYCKESVVLLNLSQHMRNYHIGLPEEIIVDGPYECTVCKKSFDDFDDLKNHAEKYLLDRIFHCAFCTKRFKSKSTIQSHMQNTHTRMPVKREVLRYDQRSLENALEAIRNGTHSIRGASRTFQVPKTTLTDKLSGKTPERMWIGGRTLLTKDEEDVIVKWILESANNGQTVTKDHLLESVEMLCKATKKSTGHNSYRPGRKWYTSFLHRHPRISERISQNLSHTKDTVTKEDIIQWHTKVEEYLSKKSLMNIDLSRIFNCDETALSLCPKEEKLASKGTKVNADKKENITFLFMTSADGKLYPPMIVHKYVRVPAIVRNTTPPEWGIGLSQSGSMTAEVFFDYIKNVFYPEILRRQVQLPIILFVDGHRSHMSMYLSEFCQQVQIEIIFLFPNSTHLLQPLDLAFFNPLKEAYKTAILQWRRNNPYQILKRDRIAPVVKSALDSMHNIKDIIQKGFTESGIYPWKPNAVNRDKIFAETFSENGLMKMETDEVIIKNEINILEIENTENATSETVAVKDTVQCIEEYLPPSIRQQFVLDENDGVFRGAIHYQELFHFWRDMKKSKPYKQPSASSASAQTTNMYFQDPGRSDYPPVSSSSRDQPPQAKVFADLLNWPKREVVDRKTGINEGNGPLSLTNEEWIESETNKPKGKKEKE